ncbi:MAG: hypothetical protein DYG98_17030 [Haliscomenobacteraceae bacterium CHB4]|nr:hypothetical protein [Haliscomenobacteraceae bacterium CHB4]
MLHHPFQKLQPETFLLLLRWSRVFFWVVLALFSAVRFLSMPRRNLSPDVILAMLPGQEGALGFWAGFDYLFMAAYTLFFTICCVWAAGRFKTGSLWYSLGIVLAWLSLVQLALDMSENYCMWQFALGRGNDTLKSWFLFLETAKQPIFAGSALYMLAVSVLVWTKVLK